MTDEGFKRKLAAILSADVAGYSRLMSEDETHTIQTLKIYRGIISDQIQNHSGRVIDSPGDNLLAEFPSAVDAVGCAVEIQNLLRKENEKFSENKRLTFRIGVNIGDIVQDGERIYGDGVNIAARIEGIGTPGGVCISRNAYDHVKDKVQIDFKYLGEHEVKNIKEPVRVYKVLLDSASPKPLVDEPLELPDKPSIAVLPFANMSGDPDQEYFSDGLTEQIINGLCKVYNLFVIARNSSFAYKNKSISIKQIAQELGVKYILEGSVQKAGERVRITAQLIDATTDYHMWSESYDRDLKDIFALQDEITIKLIGEMEISLTSGEQARLRQKDINNIQAYDKHSRGLECFFRFTKQDNEKARLFLEQGIKIEETSALIHSMLGYTHWMASLSNWSDSPIETFINAEECARKALALDDSLDVPHFLLGMIHLFKKEWNRAIIEAKRAVALNPNGADALAALGHIMCYAGEPEEAILHLHKAFRLNPVPLIFYYHILGIAYRLAGQYENAVDILNQGIGIDPETFTPYLSLTMCYITLNEFENARKAVKKLLEIDPTFSLEYFKGIYPVRDQARREKDIEILRKAGLPE